MKRLARNGAIAALSAGVLHHAFGCGWVNVGAVPLIAAVGGILVWRMSRAPRSDGA